MDREPKRDHKIYMYTNKINGKVYIGRTCRTLKERAGSDGRSYNGSPYFWSAIKKYGWDAFIPSILEDNLTAIEASEREIYWIKKYNSTDHSVGYNIIDSTCIIYTDSQRHNMSEAQRSKKPILEETRKKMSDSRKGTKNGMYGKHHTEESKQKIREGRRDKYNGGNHPMYGKHHSDEARRKMSEAQRGKKMSEESRKKISESNTGRRHSEETRRKMSKSQKGRTVSKITRDKISVANTGRHPSDETRKKMSKAQKGKKMSEEAKIKISIANKGHVSALKGKHHSEETKRKISISNKGKKMPEEAKQKLREINLGKIKPELSKKVLCIETNTLYDSATIAGKILNIDAHVIRAVAHGSKKTYKGFHWKYVA